ncbi:hypothetical protein ACFFIY_03145 [Bhargavaea ullalensis]|uniref:Methyl-accepting chemotaxis protein n=1 Tax=Bhargavaea ullalensis TaxID=1265685 RepID=A0ABV2GD75_9BACL|nr:hypothetical protein [Bhargavaea cecembensis]
MDEIVELLREMVDKLDQVDSRLLEVTMGIDSLNEEVSSIKGYGLDNSISDVAQALNDVKENIGELSGDGLYNSLTDVCNKLDDVVFQVSILD